jgi:hypothetical protein
VYCPQCGEACEEADGYCWSCGRRLALSSQPAADLEAIPSYLSWAAALLAFCWPAWPAAVTALVYASRAESRVTGGDLAGAREASRKAKQWCWITFGAGLILWEVALTLVVSLAG